MSEDLLLTGVDKLVSLVNKKERVSLKEATTELKVGPEVVTEWAEFLEDEGIISIEYKFATPYFVKRKITEKDIESKAKKFNITKDTLVRKAEGMLITLDIEGTAFKRLKEEFTKLKKELGNDLDDVKSEIEEFEKYSSFKEDIKKKMLADQNEFKKKLDEIHKEVEKRKAQYDDVIKSMDKEECVLKAERLSAKSLEVKEKQLKEKLDKVIAYAQEVAGKIDKKIENAEEMEKHNQEMIDFIEKSKKEIEDKKTQILKPLEDESEEYKKKIAEAQKNILSKVKENKKEIDEDIRSGKAAAEKFKEFFEKKVKIEKMIDELDKEKEQLTKEIDLMINKAKVFHLSVKESDFKSHAKEMEKKLKEIEKKKSLFESTLKKLSSLMKR